jgi:hypothetical protein
MIAAPVLKPTFQLVVGTAALFFTFSVTQQPPGQFDVTVKVAVTLPGGAWQTPPVQMLLAQSALTLHVRPVPQSEHAGNVRAGAARVR